MIGNDEDFLISNDPNNFINLINKNFNTNSDTNKVNNTLSNEKNKSKRKSSFIQPKEINKKNLFKKTKKELKEIERERESLIYTETLNNLNNSNPFKNKSKIESKETNKTILQIINDAEAGLPMTSEEVKKKKPKKKKEEIKENDTISIENSEISINQSGSNLSKHLLRNKTPRKEYNENNENLGSPDYSKFFKHKLIFDPVTNKMIIQKPTMAEASLKMHEEISKNNIPLLDEDGAKLKITSSSFKKLLHTDKWSREDTIFFYKALECFGTDFSFLEIVLKPRNRAQIKNKFRKEEKENPDLIEHALIKFDPKKLVKMIGVLQQFKEQTDKKKLLKSKRKINIDDKNEEFDFKKLFTMIELDKYEEENKTKLDEFIKDALFSESDGEFHSDEDDSFKTVTVNLEDQEENEYSFKNKNFLIENKKTNVLGSFVKNNMNITTNTNNTNNIEIINNYNNINNFTTKTSKVKIIINEENNENSTKITQIENKEESQVLCMDFLKKFQ